MLASTIGSWTIGDHDYLTSIEFDLVKLLHGKANKESESAIMMHLVFLLDTDEVQVYHPIRMTQKTEYSVGNDCLITV